MRGRGPDLASHRRPRMGSEAASGSVAAFQASVCVDRLSSGLTVTFIFYKWSDSKCFSVAIETTTVWHLVQKQEIWTICE